MKKLLKKLARWYFRRYIVQFVSAVTINEEELLRTNDRKNLIKYLEHKVADSLVTKMLEEGAIEFEWNTPPGAPHRSLRARISVI